MRFIATCRRSLLRHDRRGSRTCSQLLRTGAVSTASRPVPLYMPRLDLDNPCRAWGFSHRW